MNGYYVTEGKLFNERLDANNKWYSFIAYKFLEDGSFLKATKFSRDKNTVNFSDSDFKKENSGSYEFKNNQLVFHLNKGKPWEEKEYLEKSGYGEFKMKNGRKIKFKSW
ncbi:MAG: hypothetical protein PF436_10070 [Prolixibacteraceae bacterium]|nr:hypothetical protein [Prolixibacteraceae bacterium]